jgi:catechol 2,3-dioxygenase-like lactoylglutathione lyase family enzyme
MSNLENLKKQAKALVRLHRERSYHLACVAREVLPKFAGLSDNEVLAGEFKLSDAQELLARQQSCRSWSELKSRLTPEAEGASPSAPITGPSLVFGQPILYVANVMRSLDYYERMLGFSRLMTAGEPPFYAEVRRGGAIFGLRFTHRPAIDPQLRACEELLWQATVRVSAVKALYLEFVAAGAQIDTPLRREPWGAWDFAVADPDGNLIGFGEAAPDAVERA